MSDKFSKIGWLIILILLIGGGYFLVSKQKVIAPGSPSVTSSSGEPDPSLYQVIVLSNAQIYFGKLSQLNSDWPVLSDVFYLRQNLQPQNPNEKNVPPQPAFNLLPLSTEIQQPQDTMVLSKNSIVYWENLRADSQVIKTINQIKAQTK